MAGIEETNVIECYPYRVRKRTPSTMFLNRVSFMVRGQDFERHIFCPNQGPQVLISQTILEGIRYEYDVQLAANSNAVLSERHLFHSIVAAEPPADERIIEDRFMHLGWTWRNVAGALSRYANNSGAITGVDPFRIEATEAFGTEYLKREINGWSSEDFLLPLNDPDPTDMLSCCICDEDEVPNNPLIMLKVCRHIFHRRCLFPVIWFQWYNRCLICDNPI